MQFRLEFVAPKHYFRVRLPVYEELEKPMVERLAGGVRKEWKGVGVEEWRTEDFVYEVREGSVSRNAMKSALDVFREFKGKRARTEVKLEFTDRDLELYILPEISEFGYDFKPVLKEVSCMELSSIEPLISRQSFSIKRSRIWVPVDTAESYDDLEVPLLPAKTSHIRLSPVQLEVIRLPSEPIFKRPLIRPLNWSLTPYNIELAPTKDSYPFELLELPRVQCKRLKLPLKTTDLNKSICEVVIELMDFKRSFMHTSQTMAVPKLSQLEAKRAAYAVYTSFEEIETPTFSINWRKPFTLPFCCSQKRIEISLANKLKRKAPTGIASPAKRKKLSVTILTSSKEVSSYVAEKPFKQVRFNSQVENFQLQTPEKLTYVTISDFSKLASLREIAREHKGLEFSESDSGLYGLDLLIEETSGVKWISRTEIASESLMLRYTKELDKLPSTIFNLLILIEAESCELSQVKRVIALSEMLRHDGLTIVLELTPNVEAGVRTILRMLTNKA